jgi:hypothetical protein
MVAVVVALVLAAVLLASAGAKLADPAGTQAALGTYGVRRAGVARVLWALLAGVELLLAGGVALGVPGAAWAAAALFVAFIFAQASVLGSGGAGAPCACFGARGTVGIGSMARSALLATAFAAAAVLERRPLTTDEWLGVGLGFALAGVGALGVLVLALAREVGHLRAAALPQGALEIPHEGPEVGGRSALIEHFGPLPGGRLALAVFTSEGCRLCRALAPAVATLGRDPRVAVRTFDDVRDADAWAAADVPGSPFAVALGADGTVLAKGTYNTAAQLESVLATAERRRHQEAAR